MLLAATGGGFTPASLPNLWAWFDASKITGLVDNDPVSSWSDLSGNARHVTGTTTTRPLYKTSVFGSLPAVLFDGADDFLAAASGTNTPFEQTVFSVIKPTTVEIYRTWFGGSVKFGSNVSKIPQMTLSQVVELNPASSGALADNTAALVGARFSDSADTYSYRKNGGADGSGTTASTPSGRGLALGRANLEQSQDYWPGYIAETVVYSASLNDTDAASVEAYLKAKWATP